MRSRAEKHLEKENFGLRRRSRTEKEKHGNIWKLKFLGTYGSKDSLSRKTSETESDNEEYFWRREMLAMQIKWQFVSNSGPIKKDDI